MLGGGVMKRTGPHHDSVGRGPEQPHNETVQRVESADIASSGFAGDLVAHYPVKRAYEGADYIGPFWRGRPEPQIATVDDSQFVRHEGMPGRLPAVYHR